MTLRREIWVVLGGLVTLMLLLSFAAVGLFARMSPTIDRILRENMTSVEAAEEVMSTLALRKRDPDFARRDARARHALAAMRANTTMPGEKEVVDQIEAHLPRALANDGEARRRVLGDLESLIRINREAMHRIDEEARQLGAAGAWTAVLFGIAAVVLVGLSVARIERRILAPAGELASVMEALQKGDSRRRCRVIEAPEELRRVLAGVNRLLDDGLRHAEEAVSGEADTLRAALAWCLGELAVAAVVVDAKGNILAANPAALDRLAQDADGALRRALTPGSSDARVRMTPIGRGQSQVCVIADAA